MSRIIVHIGFGKTGTTTIQNDILPYLKKKNLIEILDNNKIIQDFTNFILFDDIPEPPCFHTDKILFISLESLVGWNPDAWDKCLEFNKIYFPKNAEILITFRNQKEYLRSVFIQMLHQGESDITPKDFFLTQKNYSRFKNLLGNSILLSSRHFNIDKFRYLKIEELYTSHFKKCYFVDFKSILNQSFLTLLFPDFNLSKIKISNHNKSYSKISVYLDRKRYLFLNSINLIPISSNYKLLFSKTPVYKRLMKRKKYSSIFSRLFKFIFFPFYFTKLIVYHWRFFLQKYINFLFPKKFDFESNLKSKFYKENETFYKNLPKKFIKVDQ